ncbi:hypothetical protein RSOL_424210, partial [Rhizoctonia solani AG-3 Rhs1AP]
MPEDMAQANCDMAARSLDETLKALSNQGDLTIPNITIALYATLCKNVWDDWLNRSFRQLLAEFLPDMLLDEEEGVLVEIPTGKPDGSLIKIESIAQYQGYMHKRIEEHASRVEKYGLAAAPLVSQDIREAMTSIWGLIPVDYRSRI